MTTSPLPPSTPSTPSTPSAPSTPSGPSFEQPSPSTRPRPSSPPSHPRPPVTPLPAAGKRAVLIRPPIFSIFLAYQHSTLRNVVEIPSDDEENAGPCAEQTNATTAGASTKNSPSSARLGTEAPESDNPTRANATRANTRLGKENAPTQPPAVSNPAPSTSDALPPSSPSTPTRTARRRPLRPMVPLRKYCTSYRRFLRGKDLASSNPPQAALVAHRLNNSVLIAHSETSSNLIRGIKRKWTPTTAEFVPNKRPEAVASRGTLSKRPERETFEERDAYEVPEKMRGFRVPEGGRMRTARSPREYLQLHSLALKREMPKKGTKGAKRARARLRTIDLLTPAVDVRWQLELMKMEVDSDDDEPRRVNAGCQMSAAAPGEADGNTSAKNPLDAACVEETGRLLPKAKLEGERVDTTGAKGWDTMDYREPMVIDD
ncbi:hypothetical protein ONZ51_g3631 [Trametes cubensis]|uniref:Uncharacterized protein n=1 Tax=Trametes cubensis TaxID=1111947 RepID=A0AAD7TZW7_9APHY|nr:hypothetical protein ONZ51_g3631 [Trametes cubensis]